jgi:hypothetical protein
VDLQTSSDDDFEDEVDEGVAKSRPGTRVACRKVSFSNRPGASPTLAKKVQGEPTAAPKSALKKPTANLCK